MNQLELSDTELLEYKEQCVREISKWKASQLARKVLLNSLYGAMGAEFFRYFDVPLAESVALSGQLSIKWVSERLNEYLNQLLNTENHDYCFYNDTDSSYISLDPLVSKYFKDQTNKEKIVDALDEFSKLRILPKIEAIYQELFEYMNAYENKMVMAREVISDRGFWTGKKRYCLRVWDSEGVRYENPKLKYVGLSAKSSSTNTWTRPRLVQLYEKMLDESESNVIAFIDDIRKEWNALSIEDIAIPTGVNGLEKYSDCTGRPIKGSPIHVKAALNHNSLLRDLKIKNIQPIHEGDKIKYLILKFPNQYKFHEIAFSGKFPEEFDLNEYVDRDELFERGFIKPALTVLEPLNMKHEHKGSLMDFFS